MWTNVSVLFARQDSIYKQLDCDVWDAERDARKWPGGNPIVAHPPCRLWGRLRWACKPDPVEQMLGPYAVSQVQRYGGVLEHPYGSALWEAMDLPTPRSGKTDQYGGYTIWLDQFHFGHKARKRTWLYIVGCPRDRLPRIPVRPGHPTHIIAGHPRIKHGTAWLLKADREHTPHAFARFLLTVARKCK